MLLEGCCLTAFFIGEILRHSSFATLRDEEMVKAEKVQDTYATCRSCPFLLFNC